MTDSWSSIDEFRARLKEYAKSTREEQAQEQLRQELAKAGAKDLARLTEAELATWQSKYPNPSPQATLATFEWQRRLTAMQVRSARFAAWLGLLGVVLGAVLGAFLTFAATKWFPH